MESQVRKAQQVTETFLNNHYSTQLLEDYQEWSENNSCKSYKFFSQVEEYNPFQAEENYYYNRFKRCVYQAITNLLENQAEKQQALEKLLEHGEYCKPKLRLSQGNLLLDLPVQLNTIKTNTKKDRVLACDLGVSTQVNNSILEKNGEINQLTQTEFHDHECKRKLQRLIHERKNTLNNTKQHEDLKNKEKHLREQIQHDISNHLVTKALAHKCETIVLENLSDLQAPSGMARTSRHISHWARGDLLEKSIIKPT